MGLVRKRNPGGWVRMVADQIAQQLDGVSRLIAFVGEVGDLVDGGVIQLVGLVEVGPCLMGSLFKVGKRFLFDGDDGDVVAEGAGALEGEKRKAAVSCDETNPAHFGAVAAPPTGQGSGPADVVRRRIWSGERL